ncbi:type IV conjugative transfer system protein TraL [Parvularcula oceani]|uniref:type IV conjugative transfer system protein TraL n=1 Tax=Parvularcula oceani TaxID=1247963 RepID=UPI0004E178CB|nr:type IV conjugative transfer system protein TraL [Parvularcula oceani]
MAQADRTRIPATLDDPEKLAFWTIDEFVLLIGGFMLGILLGRFVEGILLGFAAVFAIKKFKRGESLRALRHAAYWVLPSGLFGLQATLPSHKRDLAG